MFFFQLGVYICSKEKKIYYNTFSSQMEQYSVDVRGKRKFKFFTIQLFFLFIFFVTDRLKFLLIRLQNFWPQRARITSGALLKRSARCRQTACGIGQTRRCTSWCWRSRPATSPPHSWTFSGSSPCLPAFFQSALGGQIIKGLMWLAENPGTIPGEIC
jgi:hypothetical protein